VIAIESNYLTWMYGRLPANKLPRKQAQSSTRHSQEVVPVSLILGRGDPLAAFTLSPGHSAFHWWWGFGEGSNDYNVGFPYRAAAQRQPANRVVVDSHAMQGPDIPHNTVVSYGVLLHAEDSRQDGSGAVYRLQIGVLA